MQPNVSVTADPAAETTMKKRNTLTIGDQLKSYARHPGAGVLAFLTLLGAVITFALLFFLIGYVIFISINHVSTACQITQYSQQCYCFIYFLSHLHKKHQANLQPFEM